MKEVLVNSGVQNVGDPSEEQTPQDEVEETQLVLSKQIICHCRFSILLMPRGHADTQQMDLGEDPVASFVEALDRFPPAFPDQPMPPAERIPSAIDEIEDDHMEADSGVELSKREIDLHSSKGKGKQAAEQTDDACDCGTSIGLEDLAWAQWLVWYTLAWAADAYVLFQ